MWLSYLRAKARTSNNQQEGLDNYPPVKQLINNKIPDYKAAEAKMNSGKPESARKKTVKWTSRHTHETVKFSVELFHGHTAWIA